MQLSYSARAFVRSFLKHISWLVFTIGITSIVCMAQIDRAALTGTVTDPTGAMVQHAEVQAVDLATGLKSEAHTNSKGVYLVPGLAVGTYAVTISHQGFGTVGFQNVLLEVGLTRVLNVTLRVSVPGEKIHVEAAQPLEQTSPEVSGVITEQQIKEIPINGRNWATLLVLAPGAIDDGGGDQRTIRFAGRGRDDNNYMIDGMPNNDRFYGSEVVGQPGVLGAEEAVEEARPGIRRNENALARCEPRADQAAGGDLGALADLAPRQGRKNLTPDTIKGDPRLALGGIVQHLGHRAKIGAPQG